MFSHLLSHKGLVLINTAAVTWHFRNPSGGIREERDVKKWEHDENIFQLYKKYHSKRLIVLDNGMGDHIVFKKVMDEIKPDVIACCYPDVFKDVDIELISIAEAQAVTNINRFNLYGYMDMKGNKKSMHMAYVDLYNEIYI